MSKSAFLVRPALLTAVLALAVTAAADDTVRLGPPDDHGKHRYLIEFSEPGLLAQKRGRVSDERFRMDAQGMQAAREQLRRQHARYLQTMTAELGRAPEVTHYYLVTHSGMAAWLHPGEAEIVARMLGVVSVERERLYDLVTFRGPTFIGADHIWDGSATPDGTGTRGEGMVIGVLDTGVDPVHPSFANDASCGHGQGGAPDKLISSLDCALTDLDGLCIGPLPNDDNNHGTHVASTAGGNTLDGTANPPPNPPLPFTEISGVAPCAHIRSYKVCTLEVGCLGAQIQAGMNSVLLHGDVDAMNFSISGGTNPWNDNDRRKLDLVDAGVFVAASAGNTSAGVPNPVGNVNHRGPWVLSVAASTHDGSSGLLSASGPGTPPDGTQGIVAVRGSDSPIAEPFTDKPIRHFADQDPGEEGCDSADPQFPPGFFDGAVALIHRGECTFTEKITNAFDAGAEMVVIRNNAPGGLAMATPDQPEIPAYAIDQAPGNALVEFVDDNPDTATVAFSLVGDVLAGFSLRGPTPAPLQDLTKPDITAPGVSIFAAIRLSEGGYGGLSGTSMSSPHTAGAATLVRAVHPDWTVSEVKSAMMMTAFTGGTKEDGATAWDADDVGSGRVDLTEAALAGLVMDEIFDNYLAADPAQGGDVKTLNIPAVRNMDCTPSCSWTRTVRNTLDVPTSWSATGASISPGFEIAIEPASFTFGGDTSETQAITITATPQTDLTAAVAFGEVVLSEDGGLSPDLHVTVAVKGEGEAGLAPVADIAPESFELEVPQGGSAADILNIGNLGDGDLSWSISTDVPEADAGIRSHDQELDEPIDLPDFVLLSPFIGGEPEEFTVPAGVVTSGDVVGFSFIGTASGITPTLSFASDTCMIVEAPDGTIFSVGGFGGTRPECNLNAWDFQGEDSNFDGTYESSHDDVFDPAVGDEGEWTFIFINDWDDPLAGPIAWSDVTVTLHKTRPGICDDATAVEWLSASPDSGITPPAGSVPVDVLVDSTGLDPGTHEAALCVATNDPNAAVVPVPVTLTVTGEPGPNLRFDPASLDFGNVELGDTSPSQSSLLRNIGGADATGLAFTQTGDDGFDVDAADCGDTLPGGESCEVVVTFTPAETGPAAATLVATSDEGASASLGLTGSGVAEGAGFAPVALEVDPEVLASDGNSVFEPGETVEVAPAWRNDDTASQDLQGTAADFTGPDGATYLLVSDDAEYGTLDPGATASCRETGVCYQMQVSDPAVRPATHWDASFEETLSDEATKTKTWTLHLGDSFVDVPRASPFYRFVETLLHNQVTGGCTATEYCPVAETTRGQMPVFVLRALEGPDFQPPACVEGEEVFADVPATSPFCPWIEELFFREVVAGCDAESYCLNDAVNRQQMAVFLLATLEGPGFTPLACSGIFADVACPSPFADWVEELFDREITGGCATDPLRYCPTNPVNRQQMAVFLTATFGLTLYGP